MNNRHVLNFAHELIKSRVQHVSIECQAPKDRETIPRARVIFDVLLPFEENVFSYKQEAAFSDTPPVVTEMPYNVDREALFTYMYQNMKSDGTDVEQQQRAIRHNIYLIMEWLKKEYGIE